MSTNNAEVETLYRQVGFIVVQWGHCEQSLELLVNVLYLQYDGKKLTGKKKIPKQLTEKLDFVKTCIQKVPSLEPFQSELESLVSNFEALTQIRHDIVHGALSDEPAINGVFTLIRLETHPDLHEVKEFQYDLAAFPALEARLVRLGGVAPKIANRLFRARQQRQ